VDIERRKKERLTSTGKREFHFWSEKCIFGKGGGTTHKKP